MTVRPAAGGGHWVSVSPERLERWMEGFIRRHGPTRVEASAEVVTLVAEDGSRAECTVPFPPLRRDPGAPDLGLTVHSLATRTVGVLLVRRGGHAAGVVEGVRLISSKVGSRPVHGRSAAGGWSQQRFARRRDGQTRVAAEAAAEVATRVLVPALHRLDAVVTGGDRSMIEVVLADTRLAAVRALVSGPLLDVADPGQAVLEGAVDQYRAVRIRVIDLEE